MVLSGRPGCRWVMVLGINLAFFAPLEYISIATALSLGQIENTVCVSARPECLHEARHFCPPKLTVLNLTTLLRR